MDDVKTMSNEAMLDHLIGANREFDGPLLSRLRREAASRMRPDPAPAVKEKSPGECNCRVCRLGRRIESAQVSRNTDELIVLADELSVMLASAETDATYWEAKFKGDWPCENNRPRAEAV